MRSLATIATYRRRKGAVPLRAAGPGGKKVRFHYFCMDLPHSDGCFVKAYPAETAEAFCYGHVAAFDGSHIRMI